MSLCCAGFVKKEGIFGFFEREFGAWEALRLLGLPKFLFEWDTGILSGVGILGVLYVGMDNKGLENKRTRVCRKVPPCGTSSMWKK